MIRTLTLSVIAAAALGAPALAEGDPAAGEKVYNKCRACHMVGDDAQNRVGPHLNGIVGRAASAVEDFKYSDASHEAAEGGLVWTEENLAEYLASPRKFMPGNKMSFAGLRKEQEIVDVIAYLKQY